MKKIVSVLTVIFMLVAFAACSGEEAQKADNPSVSGNANEDTTILSLDGKKETVEVFTGFYVNGVKENGYDYDANGNMILDIEYMADGVNEKYRTAWQYDENNRLIKKSYQDKSDNSEEKITEYTYDENGNCYMVKGPYDHYEIKYDKNGNSIERVDYRSGAVFSRSVYENDSEGRHILETKYNADGSLNAKIAREFDSNDREVSEICSYSDGSETKKLKEYNENGETIKYQYYENGVCVREYAYLYDGNGLCTEYYDKSSHHDRTVYTYDKNGMKIKRELYRDDNLTDIYEYTYDTEGRVTSFTRYNSKGEFDYSEDIEYTSTGLRKKRTLSYSNRKTDIVEYEYKLIEVPAEMADSVRDFQMEFDP